LEVLPLEDVVLNEAGDGEARGEGGYPGGVGLVLGLEVRGDRKGICFLRPHARGRLRVHHPPQQDPVDVAGSGFPSTNVYLRSGGVGGVGEGGQGVLPAVLIPHRPLQGSVVQPLELLDPPPRHPVSGTVRYSVDIGGIHLVGPFPVIVEVNQKGVSGGVGLIGGSRTVTEAQEVRPGSRGVPVNSRPYGVALAHGDVVVGPREVGGTGTVGV